jgi:hypothetical protein
MKLDIRTTNRETLNRRSAGGTIAAMLRTARPPRPQLSGRRPASLASRRWSSPNGFLVPLGRACSKGRCTICLRAFAHGGYWHSHGTATRARLRYRRHTSESAQLQVQLKLNCVRIVPGCDLKAALLPWLLKLNDRCCALRSEELWVTLQGLEVHRRWLNPRSQRNAEDASSGSRTKYEPHGLGLLHLPRCGGRIFKTSFAPYLLFSTRWVERSPDWSPTTVRRACNVTGAKTPAVDKSPA